MVGKNGIPRAPSPGRLEQRVRDLERALERLTSARTFVSVERIVEGGTFAPAVGTQLTQTVQKEIVVGGSNLAPDALDNKALHGSSVTAVGEYTAGDSADPTNPYNPLRQVQTRAVLDARTDPDALSGKTRWPGVFLESSDPAWQGTAPYQPARVVGGEAGQAQLFSLQETPNSPKSEVRASPSEAVLRSAGSPHPTNKLPGSYSMVSVGANLFRLESGGQPDVVGANTASVSHLADGVLRLAAGRGAQLNGKPLIPITIGGMPAGAQARGIVGTGSAVTNGYGVFTVAFADGGFSSAATLILVTPTSGTAGFPVVNSGRLFKNQAEMVIPSAPNTSITYSYLVLGY